MQTLSNQPRWNLTHTARWTHYSDLPASSFVSPGCSTDGLHALSALGRLGEILSASRAGEFVLADDVEDAARAALRECIAEFEVDYKTALDRGEQLHGEQLHGVQLHALHEQQIDALFGIISRISYALRDPISLQNSEVTDSFSRILSDSKLSHVLFLMRLKLHREGIVPLSDSDFQAGFRTSSIPLFTDSNSGDQLSLRRLLDEIHFQTAVLQALEDVHFKDSNGVARCSPPDFQRFQEEFMTKCIDYLARCVPDLEPDSAGSTASKDFELARVLNALVAHHRAVIGTAKRVENHFKFDSFLIRRPCTVKSADSYIDDFPCGICVAVKSVGGTRCLADWVIGIVGVLEQSRAAFTSAWDSAQTLRANLHLPEPDDSLPRSLSRMLDQPLRLRPFSDQISTWWQLFKHVALKLVIVPGKKLHGEQEGL